MTGSEGKKRLKGTLGLAAALALAGAAAPPARAAGLEGVYEVGMRIGEREYRDLLVIDEASPGDGGVKGSFTVPGAFTARLEEAALVPNWTGEQLRFSITADEGKGPFTVRFLSRHVYGYAEFAGEARLADGSLLGTYVARRLERGGSCGSAQGGP